MTTERMLFQPRAGQEALMRDGMSALVSRGRHSVVTIRPSSRGVGTNDRPVFVVNIENASRIPLDFRVDAVQATQANGQRIAVIPYEYLVREERSRQVAAAILVGVAAGANAAANSQRGYWARRQVDEDNAAMAATNARRGQENLAALEAMAIKDHTLLPGERYAGLLHLDALNDGPRAYTIALMIGPDRHEISVSHRAED
jgi:hypothetical protein